MSTLDKIKAIKPGWRVAVQEGPLIWTGVAVQHFGQALYFVPDGSDALTAARYENVVSGTTTVRVVDTSGELDVEQVEEPWRGLSTTDVLGEAIVGWAHEDPVQSGEVHSAVAHPKDGYDEPEIAEIRVSVDLLEAFVEDEDCWFDHHGGCQAHGYLSLEPGEKCPQQELKDLLAESKENQ